MDFLLSPVEIRVLGSLIEKENTTPEYYPLTLNSLTTACNQKSNRWPTTEYADYEVQEALGDLRAKGLAAEITSGSRVNKYRQKFTEKLNLGRRETAILCVLMLRGQQTVGEIKGRTDRLYSFSDLEEVEMVLHKLTERPEGAMVQRLNPAPGMKEPRWAQTFGGEVTEAIAAPPPTVHVAADRLSALEAEVAELRREVADLRRRLEEVL